MRNDHIVFFFPFSSFVLYDFNSIGASFQPGDIFVPGRLCAACRDCWRQQDDMEEFIKTLGGGTSVSPSAFCSAGDGGTHTRRMSNQAASPAHYPHHYALHTHTHTLTRSQRSSHSCVHWLPLLSLCPITITTG